MVHTSILFVSPKGINDFDFNLTPNHNSIITKSGVSIKNRAWMKLQQEIIHASSIICASSRLSRVSSLCGGCELTGKNSSDDVDPCIYEETEIEGVSEVSALLSSVGCGMATDVDVMQDGVVDECSISETTFPNDSSGDSGSTSEEMQHDRAVKLVSFLIKAWQ